MIDLATPAVIGFLVAFAVVAVAGVIALVAAATELTSTLRVERRVRLDRHETIPAHYLGLARSH